MNRELIKSDFYKAVNGEWLEKAQIPGDKPSISAFLELHLEIEELLMDLTKKWSDNPKDLNNNMKKYIKLYQMTTDFDQREKLGAKPFDKILNQIKELKSLDDLAASFIDFTFDSIETPFGFAVMQDFMDSNNQVLYFGAANLFLPDTTYYHDKDKKQQLIGLFTQTTQQLLELYGFSKEESATLIEGALAFDALLVPVTKSRVESADYVKIYNPMKNEEVAKLTKNFDVMGQAKTLVNQDVEQLIILNPDFIHAFDHIICSEQFENMKAWMIVSNALAFASKLTDDIRVAGGAFGRALSGIQEAQSKEKFAFYQAYNAFSQIVGLFYGQTYFGPKAKEDVKMMVHEMIDIYEERISQNDWLNEKTKQKALKKLSTLTVHVGYPDELPPFYDMFDIKNYEEGSNVLNEFLKMSRIKTKLTFEKYNKAPNRNIWGMPASMVNAYYSPTNNQIVFPAAILQRPYYSLDQTPSENYGAIGAVMAHEISHAFDNNGAKFDEFGSLNNWWTDEDLVSFKKKSEDMIKLFDEVETGNGKCNGELTVSENIADSGGLRCALEASKKRSDHNFDEFFQNWARVWRQKSSKQYSELLLKVDVHGPSLLRTNMQLSNLPEFQDFYKIEKDDKMYLDKDKMVSIW